MSTVAKKVIMGGGAVAEFEIEQSIIYDSPSNSQMYFDPSSNFTSETVFTFSTWVKRASTGASQRLLTAGYYAAANNQSGVTIQFHSSDVLRVQFRREGSVTYNSQSIDSTALFRDPAAWYHILVYRSGTAIKGYVNGVEVLSGTMTANSVVGIQNTYPVMVGVSSKPTSSAIGAYESFNGNLAETHFIDGTAIAASDFGETNSDTGQWIPKEYSGSYGTNGFYLKFASGGIGADSSGNSNTMTVANLANSDVVIDTPTNNFATLNPAVSATSGMVLSEGNLKGDFRSASIANAQQAVSTIAMPAGSGKWYWEMRNTYTGLGFILGIIPKGELPRITSSGSFGYGYVNVGGVKNINGAESSYGTAWFSSGQTYIISCYYDSDNRKIGFKLNNTDQGYSSEDVTAGSYVAILSNASGGSASFPTVVNFGQNGTFSGTVTAQGNADTNGIGDFYYAPPSGYKALCTANLPDPAIALPTDHFNTKLYVGNGSIQTISGVGFQAGLTWIKNRTAADWFALTDSNRGVQKTLSSNYGNNSDGTDTGPISGYEFTYSNGLTAFNSDGFALGAKNEFNTNNEYFVSWNWKTGSNASNTDGEITTTVSANQTAGFSIMTYAGTGNSKTIGHGLSEAPTLILIKKRAGGTGATAGPAKGGNWVVGASAIDPNWTGGFYLNHTGAYYNADGSATNYFWNGAPTSSVIKLKSDWFVNGVSTTYVAYAFHDVPGYSKIGSYTGNGSATDGPFINCGFRPAFFLLKRTTATGDYDWFIVDNKRDYFNVVDLILEPNLLDAESSAGTLVDFVSNGVKILNSAPAINGNGATFLYMAFAESPFKTANAR